MREPAMRLDQPLPAELLRRTSRGLAAYQTYPVFSWPWFRKRTAIFTLALASFGALSALAVGLGGGGTSRGWAVFVHFTAGSLAIATSGPLLATLVRHRRLPLRLERVLVLLMLVLGLGISFAADSWASAAVDRNLPQAAKLASKPPEPVGAALALNVLVVVCIYGLFGGGLAVRRYLDEPRQLLQIERERELQELRARNHALDARLGTLQAQIEPHFLFNTLASLRSLIVGNPEAAVGMLDALVDYLRATIPRLRDQVVGSSLGQQLEICEHYLKLMQARMGRLEYELSIAAGLATIPFPPLLLVTLVENAIKHGIEPKAGPGRITVSVHKQQDRLTISVADDGAGLGHGVGSGVGLANVREQLKLRYGNRASFALTGRAEGGALARIVIEGSSEPEAA